MIELINIYCELEDYSSATKYVVDCIQITSSNHLSYQHALCQLYAAHIQVGAYLLLSLIYLCKYFISYLL